MNTDLPVWRRLSAMALASALALTGPTAALVADQRDAVKDLPRIAVFDRAWRLVLDNFYDPELGGLDWMAVGDRYRPAYARATSVDERSAVINAMLAELGASHTGHYTPAEPAYYQLAGIFSHSLHRVLPRHFPQGEVAYPGIGIFTRDIGGKTFVSGVLHGLPAAKAGVLVGDQILSADGAPFAPVDSFRGKVGKPVALQIRRTSGSPPFIVTVEPQRIEPNDAFHAAMRDSARIIDAGGRRIGYVRVWSYAGGRYQALLETLLGGDVLKDAEALIWDLRDGWGGAHPRYLDIFNPRGPTMTMTNRARQDSPYNVRWRKPVALLVNGGTRSGKEVLAYGFKKYSYGPVIGTRTAGALLAGRAFLLADGSLLLVAVNDVRVDGERLEGKGVAPTITVPFALPYAAGADPQLDKAVEVLSAALRG